MTAALRPVVVGVDGSPAARDAATTAARQARRALRPLRLVRAVPGTASRETERRVGDELDALRADLRSEAPAIPLRAAVREGPADLVLLDESRTAAQLVLGAGPPGGPVLGPVARVVTARASCPVLVDRPVPPGAAGVVVGVDGGPGTGALLAAATTEACLRSTSLLVVHAWRRPRETEADPRHEVAVTDSERRWVEQYVQPLRETHPGVPMAVRVVHGEARRALVAASADAELVVLGRRVGRGAPGATGPATAAAAAAPVLVVPLTPVPAVPDPRRARRSAVALSR
ncbi:universal stress protein [Geodermatophilus sp. SYSU D00697]